MKLTADDLAADIRRIDGNHNMGTGALAEALFEAGWGHIAGQQGVEDENALIKELAESAETLMDWSTRSSTGEAGIDYWTRRVADLSRRLATRSPPPATCETCNDHGAVGSGQNSEPCPVCATVQPAKPAGAVPMPFVVADAKVPGGCRYLLDGDTVNEETVGGGGKWLVSDDWIEAYGNAREAAACGVPAITEAMIEMAARKVSAIAGENWAALGDFTRGVLMDTQRQAFAAAIPQQPTAEPADIDNIALNVVRQLDPYGDPQARAQMQCRIIAAIKAEPAVEATGTVDGYSWSGQTVDIILDNSVQRWMIGDKVRVTISPTGGKSDA